MRGKGVSSLFSTHPPIEERIKRLKDLDQELSGVRRFTYVPQSA